MRIALGLLLCLCTSMVHADIYKYVDEQGHITLTDKPRPGAKKLLEDAPRRAAGKTPKARLAAPSPRDFPRVDRATQRNRDDMRRQLLMQELGNEQGSLAKARSALAEGQRPLPGEGPLSPAYLDRQKRLEETVRLHEKNIEMLNKELAHIR